MIFNKELSDWLSGKVKSEFETKKCTSDIPHHDFTKCPIGLDDGPVRGGLDNVTQHALAIFFEFRSVYNWLIFVLSKMWKLEFTRNLELQVKSEKVKAYSLLYSTMIKFIFSDKIMRRRINSVK